MELKLTLLYYCAKLFGLAPVALKNGKFYPTFLSKVYPITLAVGYSLMLPVILHGPVENQRNTTSHIDIETGAAGLDIIASHVGLASGVISLVLNGEKIVHLMNDLCVMGTEFKSFGIVEDRGKYMKNLFKTTMKGSTLVGITYAILTFHDSAPPVLAITLLFKDFNSWGTILIFSQILICVRQRFAILNDKLCNGSEDHRENNQPGSVVITDLERIGNIRILHSKLWNLVDQTTSLFSVPILLCVFRLSPLLISFSYREVSVLLDPSQFTRTGEDVIVLVQRHAMPPLLLMTVVTVQLYFLFHTCVTTCQQGNAAKVTLFEIWNKFELTELKNEFLAFSAQLMNKPVAVSPLGFFNLDYSCLVKIFGAVIAYCTIMVQIDKSSPSFVL